MLTVEFDVEICAPATMRVVEVNFDVSHWARLYDAQWVFKVQVLDDRCWNGMMTEEQY